MTGSNYKENYAKMDEKTSKGNLPDYTSSGIAVWKSKTKEGKPMLSIKVVGQNTVYAFENEKKVSNVVTEPVAKPEAPLISDSMTKMTGDYDIKMKKRQAIIDQRDLGMISPTEADIKLKQLD